MNDDTVQVVEGRFESLKKCKKKLEESMKGSEFVFDNVHLLYYKCHEINLNRGGSYIDSPDWIPINKKTMDAFNLL